MAVKDFKAPLTAKLKGLSAASVSGHIVLHTQTQTHTNTHTHTHTHTHTDTHTHTEWLCKKPLRGTTVQQSNEKSIFLSGLNTCVLNKSFFLFPSPFWEQWLPVGWDTLMGRETLCFCQGVYVWVCVRETDSVCMCCVCESMCIYKWFDSLGIQKKKVSKVKQCVNIINTYFSPSSGSLDRFSL